MRRRSVGKEKGSIDKRVNDLLYRSLPASSRFLPASVHTHRGRSISWNNCDRSWVGQVEAKRADTFVLRIFWIISYRIQPSSWHCAALFRDMLVVRTKRYLVNEHGVT